MKIYQTNEIRNICLLGNAGSGKTTITEAMLYAGGVVNRRGEVNSKNTVSDYREIEHEQQGSVFSTVLYTEYKDIKFNILDAPGADDFVNGAISSLHATETALIVLNSQNGIEVGAEIGWRNCKKFNQPVIFVANHLDHDNTNFEKTIEDAKQYFGSKVVVTQYPVNQGPSFDSVIDVLTMKMYKWGKDGGDAEVLDIPDAEMDNAMELQATLMEAAAENDEALMELFFENESLSPEEMIKGIRLGIRNRELFPVVCTVGKKDMGVRRLLDFVAQCAPNPTEVPAPTNKDGKEVPYDANGPLALFVFKNAIEQHLGEITYFKVMSGTLEEGVDLINVNKSSKERLTQLYLVAGKNRTKINKLVAGDIGATVKLKDTKTNHTLCEKDTDWEFPEINFPEPKFRIAIKAVNESDEEKLSEALTKFRQEDPTLITEYSKELKQLILHGQGEFHLNTVKWHLDNIYKIDTTFLPPRISYRETITKSATATYRHKKQSGGAGQFGEVHMFIEPYVEGKPAASKFKIGDKESNLSVRGTEEISLPWGGKLVFHNCIVGGVIDARFLPAILKGIMEKMEEGPLTGSYARDICVYIYDGKMHPVDSNEISFKLAGLNAFKAAFKEAKPKIMEPVFDVEVLVQSERMGDVMSDLQGRRAMIEGMSSEGGFEKIKAKVPLAEMNKYSTTLSSLTNGRAMYSMKFAEFQQVPPDVQEKLLKNYEAEQEEE